MGLLSDKRDEIEESDPGGELYKTGKACIVKLAWLQESLLKHI